MDKYKGLEFGQDIDHTDHTYTVKIVCMLVLVALLGLVIAGFTGQGPVSKHVAGSLNSGAMIMTDKYVRYESPMKLEVLANTEVLRVKDSLIDISLPGTYIQHFKIESILPEPERTEILNNKIVFRFAVKERGKEQRIVFNLKPQDLFRRIEGVIKIEDHEELPVWHFVYP